MNGRDDSSDTIRVKDTELGERISRVRAGMDLAETSDTLGGDPFERDEEGGGVRWRFFATDDGIVGSRYRIYEGTFDGETLVEGFLLPNG